MLKIKTFPRIHISLIGMNLDGYRINGGIGFSLDNPTLNITFEPSDSIHILDRRSYGLMDDELVRLNNFLYKVANKEHFNTLFNCVIHESMIRSHVGFGSNSMIYLSCAEALLHFNTRKYNKDEVISISGRGGTSGIGINTYFNGGFVFDTGVLNKRERVLSPSSSLIGERFSRPLLMKSIMMPSWTFGICIPPIKILTEQEEVDFFRSNCPIKKEDVENVLYEAVYGIASSILENDIHVFCKSIDAIQNTRWKKLERSQYGNDLLNVETIIKNAGASCVGMSSLGPLLFFFGDGLDNIIGKISLKMPDCICFKASTNNSGRVLYND